MVSGDVQRSICEPVGAPVLRDLLRSDREALREILARAGNFNAAEQSVAMELVDFRLAEPLRDDYRFVVADHAGRPVGYACYGKASLSDGTYDMYWIVVDGDCRRCGIGTLLVEYCEDQVRKLQGRSLLIETSSRPGYEGTVAFYRRLHYEVIAKIRDYYSAGDDKYILAKYFSD
jgi:ribosomal protein S18 acetylase RimI-like enzyme